MQKFSSQLLTEAQHSYLIKMWDKPKFQAVILATGKALDISGTIDFTRYEAHALIGLLKVLEEQHILENSNEPEGITESQLWRLKQAQDNDDTTLLVTNSLNVLGLDILDQLTKKQAWELIRKLESKKF